MRVRWHVCVYWRARGGRGQRARARDVCSPRPCSSARTSRPPAPRARGNAAQVERLEASIKEARAAADKVQKEYNALSEKARARGGGVLRGLRSLAVGWRGVCAAPQAEACQSAAAAPAGLTLLTCPWHLPPPPGAGGQAAPRAGGAGAPQQPAARGELGAPGAGVGGGRTGQEGEWEGPPLPCARGVAACAPAPPALLTLVLTDTHLLLLRSRSAPRRRRSRPSAARLRAPTRRGARARPAPARAEARARPLH